LKRGSKNNSHNFYKERVEHAEGKTVENVKMLRMLEKKEKEIFERLKNTYGQQDIELKKMDKVMQDSKEGFYNRKPASPEHNKMRTTAASSNFQMSPKKSETIEFKDAKKEPVRENPKKSKVVDSDDDKSKEAI